MTASLACVCCVAGGMTENVTRWDGLIFGEHWRGPISSLPCKIDVASRLHVAASDVAPHLSFSFLALTHITSLVNTSLLFPADSTDIPAHRFLSRFNSGLDTRPRVGRGMWSDAEKDLVVQNFIAVESGTRNLGIPPLCLEYGQGLLR